MPTQLIRCLADYTLHRRLCRLRDDLYAAADVLRGMKKTDEADALAYASSEITACLCRNPNTIEYLEFPEEEAAKYGVLDGLTPEEREKLLLSAELAKEEG